MKILQICSIFPPSPQDYGSGIVRVVYDLSRELLKRGHEVEIYTSAALDPHTRIRHIDNPVNIEGVKIHYFPYVARYYLFFVTPGIIPALRENVSHFDIVHLNDVRCFQSIVAHHYTMKHGIPYVVQPHNSMPRLTKGISKWLFDTVFGYRILKAASKVIAVSKEEAEYVKQMVVEPEKISTIYNGMDIGSFKNLPQRGRFRMKYGINTALILYLGRIHKTKGIDYLINGFSELCKVIDQVTLVIAGRDDGYKVELDKLIKRLNLSNKVIFTGPLDSEDKLSAYVDADLFIHAVRYMGGVGITPLEAILCGTPVIVTEECGEVIKEANCGYFVEYGDIEDLKLKMKRALGNPEEGKMMVERGKKYIYENLAWDRVIEKYEGIYSEVLNRRKE